MTSEPSLSPNPIAAAGQRLDQVQTGAGLRNDPVKALPRPITLVLDHLNEKRDIAAVFRLAEGFSVDKLWICGSDHKIRRGKISKMAQGAGRAVPWDRAENVPNVVAGLKADGAKVVVFDNGLVHCRRPVPPPAGPTCLVFGAAKEGLPRKVLDLADAVVRVSWAGIVRPLTAATAAAALLTWLAGPQVDQSDLERGP
jgi:23S rRNA (guanosine2251-2'-O)-methyltransferase